MLPELGPVMGTEEKCRDRVLGKGESQQTNVLKIVLPQERLGGGFLVWGVKNSTAHKDQGREKLALFSQLVFIGLVVFWNKECFINIFHLLGGLLLQNSKILLSYSLRRDQDPAPKAGLTFLDCSSQVSASPPLPDQQLFECALWSPEKVMEAKVYSRKTSNEGHRNVCAPLCLGAPLGTSQFIIMKCQESTK